MLTLHQEWTLYDCLRKQNQLTNEDLIRDLTDSFTADVQEQLDKGAGFETALAAVVDTFGGQTGLQRMERRYNRITFRRYDALWTRYWHKRVSSFHVLPLLIYGLVYWKVITLPKPRFDSLHDLVNSPWGGVGAGIVLGLLLGLPLGSYLYSLARRGFHNLPTPVVYVLTRFVPLLSVAYLISGIVLYLASYLPQPVYAALLTTCILLTLALLLSYRHLHQQLFETEPVVY